MGTHWELEGNRLRTKEKWKQLITYYQTLYVLTCIKCMNVTRTKCAIAMYKVSKNQISRNLGPLIEHGPHWINFNILTFTTENNRYFKGLHKIWNKIISFDMKKKKWNVRHFMGNVKKKVNLRVLRVSPYVSKGVFQSCLDPHLTITTIPTFKIIIKL
jgi:hypothetical protein